MNGATSHAKIGYGARNGSRAIIVRLLLLQTRHVVLLWMKNALKSNSSHVLVVNGAKGAVAMIS